MNKMKLILVTLFTLASGQKRAFDEINIRISKNVPSTNCVQVLDNLQALLTSSSAKFHSATGQTIHKVIFHLPGSWRHSPCPVTVSQGPRPDTEDVLVDEAGLEAPRGSQYGGCGVRGRGVLLPHHLLTQNITDSLDHVFFDQLVRNSFGLFPNQGDEASARFPTLYTVGDQVFDNVGCPNSSDLCSDSVYNRDAPTKQNLLCHDRSWLNVIQAAYNNRSAEQSTEDDLSSGWTAANFSAPKIEYRVESVETPVVFLLDRSAGMEQENRWSNLHNALHRIISDLPSGTEIGIITYDAEAKVNLNPTKISELNRAGIHGKVPGRVVKRRGKSCLLCGLKSAKKMVKNGGKVIVVTSATADDDDAGLISQVLSDVPVYVVGYLGNNIASMKNKTEYMYVVDDRAGVENVADALYQIFAKESVIESRFKFYNREHKVSGAERVDGKFVVEDSLRDRLHVVASTDMKEDIENFELVSPSGKQFQFPVVEKGILHFQFPGTSERGVWSYQFKTVSSASRSQFVVTVSAAARTTTPPAAASPGGGGETTTTMSTPRLDVWTDGSNPSVIYAQVRLGFLPVFNASLTASIGMPGVGNLELVKLADGGGGYPDVTPGDGIYSAYFTQLSTQPGFASVQVTATDGAGSARLREQAEDSDNVSGSLEIPTPSFTRYAQASLYLAESAEYFIRDGIPQMDDLFPPARITDLRVSSYGAESLEATLSWTAPGDDFNLGTAFRYEIRCYTNRHSLSQENFSVSGIPVPEDLIPVPQPAGAGEQCNITLPWQNEVFYYAVVAIDDANNRGEVSNLVPVYVAEIPTSTTNLTSSSPLQSAPLFNHGDDNVIYIVSGSLTGLALIALCLGIAFICRTKRKEVTDKSNTLAYIKELGPPSLLPSTKYSYTQESGAYHASTATYSTVVPSYSISTHPCSSSDTSYSPEPGSQPGETGHSVTTDSVTYLQETSHYAAESMNFVAENAGVVGGGNYSPPRTSPSEYSADSVFISPPHHRVVGSSNNNSTNPMYSTYQNLPGRIVQDQSESELSEASTDSSQRRRDWDPRRKLSEQPQLQSHWSAGARRQQQHSEAGSYSATWSEKIRGGHDVGLPNNHSVEVSSDKRRRRESFV